MINWNTQNGDTVVELGSKVGEFALCAHSSSRNVLVLENDKDIVDGLLKSVASLDISWNFYQVPMGST